MVRDVVRELAAVCVGLLFSGVMVAQSAPGVTDQARVDRLLNEMTLKEKLTLIHGTLENPSVYQGQAGYLGGIPRLGIPGLRMADGPPGVLTRVPSEGETATMGVAATFSVQDAQENGVVIGREDRANGIDVSLQPFVNIDRDLQFARGYNTFGEDPLLTSVMGAGEIRGIQSQDEMAMVKHFVAYDSNATNIYVDDQTLHEVYLAPFDAAIKAGVAAMMCSYNRINGDFACGNKHNLTTILRDQMGFKGFVTSDWGAVHAVTFINDGLDMEMPGAGIGIPSFFSLETPPPPPADESKKLMEMFGGHIPEEPAPARSSAGDFGVKLSPERMPAALKGGTVTPAAITRAAGSVLDEIDRFGYLNGTQKHSITPQDISANAKIIEKTGEDAAVLLKDDNQVLPLTPAELSDVVLIGPTAGQVDSIGISGERSDGLPWREVGPLAAMRKISGNPKIQYQVADDMTGSPIPASLFSHQGKPGLLRTGAGTTSVDAQVNFTATNHHPLPANSTLSWKGTLTPPSEGDYWIYLQALGTNATISIDGKLVARTGAFQGGVHGDILQANQDNVVPTTDGLDNVRRAVQLTAGPHAIEVNITPDSSQAPVQVRLNWYTPQQRKADDQAAVDAARSAKVAVVFAWTRLTPVFGLPGDQDKLIEDVAAVNPNTIVVLNTSQPVALPWLKNVKAVLEMWWPGDEGGWSTANLLLGKVSPAGRLPVTWGKALADYPATDPRYPERSEKGVKGRTTYSEGVNVGYRWFAREHIQPLFPFGYGMSYTKFAYSGLEMTRSADGGVNVTVQVRNTGNMDSDEVPQVYLGSPASVPDGVQFPVLALAAFDRIHIPAGETRAVTMKVPLRQLQYWSTKEQQWILPSGRRMVMVGPSSATLPLQKEIDLSKM